MEPAINSDMTRETTERYCWDYQLVGPSVGRMTLSTTSRFAYDDASTPAEMSADCLAVQAALVRPVRVAAVELAQEQGKRGIEVPEAAVRLARALHLQLDGE